MLTKPHKMMSVLVISLAFVCGIQWLPVAAHFEPSDVQVTEPGAAVVDMEFDQESAQFAWISGKGELWIGKVDSVTGDFTPPSGKAIFVDNSAVPVKKFGNGPEWVYTSSGAQIVYTKYTKGLGFSIARAKSDNGGISWTGKILFKSGDRRSPIGSLDPSDPSPRISYIGPDANGTPVPMWRNLDVWSSEEIIAPFTIPPGRWVPGRRAIVKSEETVTGTQVFLYDVDTTEVQQLTNDSGEKSAAFMWQAPEVNNQYVLMTLIDETEIGLYTECEGIWTKFNTVKPPSIGNFLWSPEPFVYNGRSYIVMVTSKTDDQKSLTAPTDIWLAGIDPTTPFYRQLSDSTIKVRKDPEVFITLQGPFVYYAGQNVSDDSRGIFRVDTGFGPPQ